MGNEKIRREALYNWLIDRGDEWASMREIVKTLAVFYQPKEGEDGKSFHQSAARRTLTEDIKEINISQDYQKIIITGSKGVKLATRDEMIQHICRIYAANMRRLYYAKIIRQKAGLDGQYTTEENEHIETFIQKYFGGNN